MKSVIESLREKWLAAKVAAEQKRAANLASPHDARLAEHADLLLWAEFTRKREYLAEVELAMSR